MAKVVQVVNKMIENQRQIENVFKNGKEYFFLYKDKFKWSIARSDEDEQYYLHFYPTDSLAYHDLIRFTDWQNFDEFITYKTSDIKTREAEESFRELYQIVSNKVFRIDDLFDEIIDED